MYMMLNGTTSLVLIVCIFASVALGQDGDNNAVPDKCRSPPRFRNVSSCCEIPNLIEDSVLEECGIPLDLGQRMWLRGPWGPHHHHGPDGAHHGSGCGHHGPGDGHHGPGGGHHGPGGGHHGPGGGDHGPGGGHHGHGSEQHGPHDQQGNGGPSGAERPASEGASVTEATDEEWPVDGDGSSVNVDVETVGDLRRSRRQPGPHHHGHRHHGPPPCDKELCVFRKLNLLGANEKVDTDAFTTLLDQLAAKNAVWRDAKDAAVTACVTNKETSHRPFGVCEPLHLLVCTTENLFKNCPEDQWKAEENCTELKTFMRDCSSPGGQAILRHT